MKKIIIGIVAKHRKEIKKRTDLVIRDEVKQAIFDNGAIAIGILYPNEDINLTLPENNEIKNFEIIIEQIKLCDGIILQGGNANDHFELEIAKYCYENDIPILGICAGQNCIVKAVGGTTRKISNPEKHYDSEAEYVHGILIKENTKFYDIIKTSKIPVNSRHFNTIENPAKLTVSAVCEDGYIDVVEDSNKRYYIGMRFHPESLYKQDKNMNGIFKAFLKSCTDKDNQI